MELLKSAQFQFDPKPKRIFIGVSGGLDSVVLLDLLAQHQHDASLIVLHVNHHLQPESNAWADFVSTLAEKYAFESGDLNPADFKNENVEAKAREGRYAFFESHLQHETDYLLLAHHQQDQIETFFLNLQRGAGLAGLAAMPIIRPFGPGQLMRPLLNCSRQDLEAYAKAKQLKWIEDPTNQDTLLNRNFLRHQVLRMLSERWPHFSVNAGAAIAHLQSAREVLEGYLAADLAKLVNPLDLSIFKALPVERHLLLLQRWIKQYGGKILGEVQLQVILKEVIQAGPDANPVFQIPGLKIYRQKQKLFLE